VGDGCCDGHVVKLATDGTELWRGSGFRDPTCVSANAADGSCWVADWRSGQVVHLSASGTELWRGGGFSGPCSLSVNPTDGSCWVTDRGNKQVVHVSENGDELWRGGGFNRPEYVSVNPADGSCWVADYQSSQVVHLSAAGEELWRGGAFHCPHPVSVNPADGSCWVADIRNSQIAHLVVIAAPRADFAASPLAGPAPLEVDFTDLSVASPTGPITAWDWDFGDGGTSTEQDPTYEYTEVGIYTVSLTVTDASGSDTETKEDYIHVTALPPVADFTASPLAGVVPLEVEFTDLSVASPTGSITAWDWDFGDGAASTQQNPSHEYSNVGTYSVSLTVTNAGGSDTQTKDHYIHATFPDVPVDYWAMHQILACVDAGIVKGYPDGTYRPEQAVTRDQIAVYISRALAGGDANVPTGPATATFPDVPTDHWVFKYVEYCYDQAVVVGYWDGYHPDEVVNRAQMAVFVARAMVAPNGDVAIPDPVPPPTFPDVLATYWAYKWIEYCYHQGVVEGYSDGYRPEETVNRAQMAVYVQRAFQLPL
jgi:PKD repeat protein